MPFNFRLNVQNVFRRLGIQADARLPQLNDNVQMTMLLTDLSRLIPAPIEPRGLASANILPLAGVFAVCQLQALAPGGLFIEQIILRGQSPGVGENYTIGLIGDLSLPTAFPIVNIGGTPVVSVFTGDSSVDPLLDGSLPAPDGFSTITVAVGFFVPNQAFFTMRSTAIGDRLDIALIFRELPSIEEVG